MASDIFAKIGPHFLTEFTVTTEEVHEFMDAAQQIAA